MSEEVTEKFIEALHMLEDSKDVEPLAALYLEGSVVGNLIAPDKFQGRSGAKEFWTEYRATFETAKSTFRNVVIGEGNAALEWTTQGTGFDGQPFSYSGVTILEIEGSLIRRSSAYFDPKALGKQLES